MSSRVPPLDFVTVGCSGNVYSSFDSGGTSRMFEYRDIVNA